MLTFFSRIFFTISSCCSLAVPHTMQPDATGHGAGGSSGDQGGSQRNTATGPAQASASCSSPGVSRKRPRSQHPIGDDGAGTQEGGRVPAVLPLGSQPVPDAIQGGVQNVFNDAMKVSAVLAKLSTTDLASFTRMYSPDFLKSASLPLLGSDTNLNLAFDVAIHNAHVTDDDPRRFLVVKGVPGSGKTRLGYEVLRMWDDPDRLGKLAGALGHPVHLVRLFSDFNNGGRFLEDVDGDNMAQNLGARLASQALGVPLDSVKILSGGSLTGLTVANVLGVALQRMEAKLHPSIPASAAGGRGGVHAAVDPPSAKMVFLVAVHLDEYQVYMSHLALCRRTKQGQMSSTDSVDYARWAFKQMLSALNHFARSSVVQDRWRVILLPIVSGTPVLGVPMLATDKLAQRLLSPAILDRTSAEQLVASVFTSRCLSDAFSELDGAREVVLSALRRGAARLAIGDSGFRPRLLVNLGQNARGQTERIAAACQAEKGVIPDVASCLSSVDWRAARDSVAVVFHGIVGISGAQKRALVKAALLQTPIRFVFDVDEQPGTLEEKALQAGEAAGLVHLDTTADEDYRVVRMPLMQVKEWGTVDFLPPAY
ncbi:hypothetical protein BU14_0127s0028 [Porphyra umbilicalis]|uniref:Uncharacterized protein n=1 Tax=Porphyra umbilicalis TaxID=2786 RepID=A0A1X6PAM2_PORUM|nr:hypothetical protein BU14_0127s0028 [Porphyra umbilicalis]|eukprot:OSX77932.1 hypothetical protein BU14_0127s0028 [Porphyra umbilicalis]